MLRKLSIVLAATAALVGAPAANAQVRWSIGVNLPVVVPSGGYYVQEPALVYYQPAPVVRYAPVYDAPRYDTAPTVVYAPQGEYDGPQPVYQVRYRGWRGDPYERREQQRRDFEHARWERARHDGQEHGDRGHEGHRGDDDGRGWHRD